MTRLDLLKLAALSAVLIAIMMTFGGQHVRCLPGSTEALFICNETGRREPSLRP